MIALILGGTRSGKSDYALTRLHDAGGRRVLLATGRAADLSFRRQILDHRAGRDPRVPVVEVGLDLPRAINEARMDYASILVDSLDFWIFAACEAACDRARTEELMACLSGFSGAALFLVSSEIGLGPLPADAATRGFARTLGALNQATARLADEVVLVTAGLPLTLKKAEHGLL